jgi:hypothetical protein
MFRRAMRSNWLFLIIAAVLLGTFDRGLFLGFHFCRCRRRCYPLISA